MDVPLLLITPEAQAKIAAVAKSAGHPDARLRVAITGHRGPSFTHSFSLVSPNEVDPTDLVVQTPQGVVYVPAADADNLRGTTIRLNASTVGGAIAIDNPNAGWADPIAARVQFVIDTQVNPGVAAHGRYIDLLEVRDGTAFISMSGGRLGYAQVDVTLLQGAEVSIRQAVPEIIAIVDTTDHASG